MAQPAKLKLQPNLENPGHFHLAPDTRRRRATVLAVYLLAIAGEAPGSYGWVTK